MGFFDKKEDKDVPTMHWRGATRVLMDKFNMDVEEINPPSLGPATIDMSRFNSHFEKPKKI